MIKKHEITSLPPGFVIITYDPDQMDSPEDLRVTDGTMDELLLRGYTGFLVVPKGVTVQSLSPDQLKAAGLSKSVGSSWGQSDCYSCGKTFKWSHTAGVIPTCDRCMRIIGGD